MRRVTSRQRPAFTLVELLVVMAIVALLIAMLLPALAKARDAAISVKCLSQTRQLGVLAAVYAADNRDFLVPAAGQGGNPGRNKYRVYNTGLDALPDSLGYHISLWELLDPKGFDPQAAMNSAFSDIGYCPGAEPWPHVAYREVTYGLNFWISHYTRAPVPPALVHTRASEALHPSDTLYFAETHNRGSSARSSGAQVYWNERIGPTPAFPSNFHVANFNHLRSNIRHSQGFNVLKVDGHATFIHHDRVVHAQHGPEVIWRNGGLAGVTSTPWHNPDVPLDSETARLWLPDGVW